jgi:nucleoside-diphosphate-sugar epimerase
MTPRTILVSGACGNVGTKVIEALAATPWCTRIIGIDRQDDAAGFSAQARSRLELVAGDLTQPEPGWRAALNGIDAVVHLAALYPQPDASWAQSLASFDMTANLLLAAVEAGVGRFVFASSNHVMGGYKDAPLSQAMGPGRLTTTLDPAPGTRWHDGTRMIDSTPYATAKVMGERLCQAMADALSSVSIRIGWVQTGANDPRTITYAGNQTAAGEAMNADDRRALRWYRNMWLSNADLGALTIAAITADASAWPSRAIIVNGVSRNRDTDWDLASAEALIGYTPQDDLYAQVR